MTGLFAQHADDDQLATRLSDIADAGRRAPRDTLEVRSEAVGDTADSRIGVALNEDGGRTAGTNQREAARAVSGTDRGRRRACVRRGPAHEERQQCDDWQRLHAGKRMLHPRPDQWQLVTFCLSIEILLSRKRRGSGGQP